MASICFPVSVSCTAGSTTSLRQILYSSVHPGGTVVAVAVGGHTERSKLSVIRCPFWKVCWKVMRAFSVAH